MCILETEVSGNLSRPVSRLDIEPQIIMDPDDPALETNVADTDVEDPIVGWEQNKLVSGSAGRKSWLCERLLLGHIIFAFLNNRRG